MSTDLSDDVLDEAASSGETLIIHDLLRLIERYDTGPGVPDQRLDAYISTLGRGRFDENALREGLDTHLVDAEEWVDESTVYRLEGGVSAFPPQWHDELTDKRDLLQYVATMTAAVDGGSEEYAHGGRGDGVPERLLVDTVAVFGGYTYQQIMAEVDRLRDEDLLTAGADQHRNARVQLTPSGADHLGVDPEDDAVEVKTGTNRTKDPRIDE